MSDMIFERSLLFTVTFRNVLVTAKSVSLRSQYSIREFNKLIMIHVIHPYFSNVVGYGRINCITTSLVSITESTHENLKRALCEN